jgi:hypothetical protein
MSDPTKKIFKLTDQVIGQIKELLQLAILTNTPIIDHFRTIELEESDTKSGSLILSEAYCVGWNEMATKMYAEAEAKHERESTTLATDESLDDEQDAQEDSAPAKTTLN